MNEFFKINGIDVGFADHPTEGTIFIKGSLNTEVLIRKGKLRINVLTPALELTKGLHNGLLDDPYYENQKQVDWIRMVTYADLSVPGGKYDTQIACPYEKGPTGFEVYGFPELVDFHGIIDVQKGYVHIKGELRSKGEGNPNIVPIEVVKHFEPKPLLPPRRQYTWEEAVQQNPLNIYDLSIGKGIFNSFPEEILTFKNLERLWMGMQAHLQFSSLPDTFYDLKQLHTLQIYGSKLEQLSPKIGQLQKLEDLAIQSSALTSLPDAVCSLPKLTSINLKYNRLSHLPDAITTLTSLKYLDIEGNNFKTLPKDLDKIYSVKADRKHRKLYMDISYKSENLEPIQKQFYDLSAYPAQKAHLEEAILAIPALVPFKDLILDYSAMGTYLVLEEKDTEIPLGKSKVGGSPDLPRAWEHPTNKNGALYIFHAQINCTEIAPFQEYLPRKGMLYFFVNDEEYAQQPIVLYAKETSHLVRIPYTEATKFTDSDFNANFRKGQAVRFENAIALPCFYNSFNHGTERFPKYAALWEEEEEEFYEQLDDLEYQMEALEKAIKKPLGFDNGHIQIGTHGINCSVFTQHESPEEWAAARFGGEPTEWLVLLNMESIGEFNFWDAGTLTYCIHKKDLAILDFSRIHTSIESS